jgi:hypothetical protein
VCVLSRGVAMNWRRKKTAELGLEVWAVCFSSKDENHTLARVLGRGQRLFHQTSGPIYNVRANLLEKSNAVEKLILFLLVLQS